jgi:MFS family permease
MMMGSGLFNTFVSVKLEIAGYKPEAIGIVTSALYVGILIGSIRIDRWISRIGHIRSFVAIASLMAFGVFLQSLWLNLWFWAFLRIIAGICLAGVFVIIESWLLMLTPSNQRGAILSVYLGVLYAALSLGQLLIDLTDLNKASPFYITSLFTLVSIIPVKLRKITEPKIEETSSQLSLIQLYQISPLGFVGGIVSGMVLAVTYGLVPVYAKEAGMSIQEIGTFMAVLIFGGFSLQWPVGKWADRGDRRHVIFKISFITALVALVIPFIQPSWFLLALIWAFGGFAFTIYPVSMAFACEKMKESEIVAVTGSFVLSYSLGAIAGPLIAPFFMDQFGAIGVFYFLSLISFILGSIGLGVLLKNSWSNS